jgi:hypothetical protein
LIEPSVDGQAAPIAAIRVAPGEDIVMGTRVFADEAAAVFKAGSDSLFPLLDVP